MNVTNHVWHYKNVSELAFKAHIESSFCIFLNSLGMPDFISECDLHVDQLRKRKVIFCQNYMIKRTIEKVILQPFGE